MDPENSSTYKCMVGIDTATDKVIAIGTLFIERKFYRNCAKLGNIEDIVVHKDYGNT